MIQETSGCLPRPDSAAVFWVPDGFESAIEISASGRPVFTVGHRDRSDPCHKIGLKMNPMIV